MAKLKDMKAWELMGALAELAEPVRNLTDDEEFWDAFVECNKRGVGLQQKNTLRFLLHTYGTLFPLMMGEEHRKDTLRILAILQGKPLEEVLQMNGTEVLKGFVEVYRETLIPFFTSSGLSDITE